MIGNNTQRMIQADIVAVASWMTPNTAADNRISRNTKPSNRPSFRFGMKIIVSSFVDIPLEWFHQRNIASIITREKRKNQAAKVHCLGKCIALASTPNPVLLKIYWLVPVVIFLHITVHDVGVKRFKLLRDRAHLPIRDRMMIDQCNRGDLSGSTCHEEFVT